MKRTIVIVGGKLQGTEAVVLAGAAGMETVLIDRDPRVPASGLADRFLCADVVARDPAALEAIRTADVVLPTNENDALLAAICEICGETGTPLAFDPDAYRITKSKTLTDRMLHENGFPSPRYYPEGAPPYIIKPSGESGSAGVRRAETRAEVEAFLAACPDPDHWIAEEYLTGPSYSIEVVGRPGLYRTYTVTQIHMDAAYDCRKVTAPCLTGTPKEARFRDIAVRAAELVGLRGVMDVEVIDDGTDLKILELDARLPSQTPIAVWKASGMNLVEELVDLTLDGGFRTGQRRPFRWSTYEHYRRENGAWIQEGEHMMTQAGPLHLDRDFCGCQMVISDCPQVTVPAGAAMRGIFVSWDDTPEGLADRRRQWRQQLFRLP